MENVQGENGLALYYFGVASQTHGNNPMRSRQVAPGAEVLPKEEKMTKVWLRRASMYFGMGCILTWVALLLAPTAPWIHFAGAFVAPICWAIGAICLEKANKSERREGGGP